MAPGVYECWGSFAESWGLKAYVTWMTLAVFILPVLVITVCQVERDAPGHFYSGDTKQCITGRLPSLFPQVRIFMEIHNNLYLKSERHLSPASLPTSRRDSQRGAGAGGSRGRSSLPLYVSPLMFNNPGSHTSFDPGSTYQNVPMGPLRSNSFPSHCDIHTYTTAHPGELHRVYS